MEGLFVNKAPTPVPGDAAEGADKLRLLAKLGDLEIMCQQIAPDATVWIVPAGDDAAIEFFYVHKGEIIIDAEKDGLRIREGESFYVRGLRGDLPLKTVRETELIYVSTIPVFDTEQGFQAELTRLVEQINEKDNYTGKHSRNVMRYAVKLYRPFKALCPPDGMNALVVASLFHDVGKCRTPDEILKKQSRLSPEEYAAIKRHPLDSADILTEYFDERIAGLARDHHERLNGSGYPRGISGDALTFEARILAVADAFDAMTTSRGYNRVKGFAEAAAELQGLPEQYDSRVTAALMALVERGEIALDARG